MVNIIDDFLDKTYVVNFERLTNILEGPKSLGSDTIISPINKNNLISISTIILEIELFFTIDRHTIKNVLFDWLERNVERYLKLGGDKLAKDNLDYLFSWFI